MQAPANVNFLPTATALLDKNIATLQNGRQKLKRRATIAVSVGCVFAVAGLIVLLLSAFIFGQTVVGFAVAAVLLFIGAVSGLVSVTFHNGYSRMHPPLQLSLNVRGGLLNAGFVYDNHRSYFRQFWVFQEQEGGRVAIVDLKKPFEPMLLSNGEYISMKLDNEFAFIGRVGERQPNLADFVKFPDYRYRKRSHPIAANAELSVSDGREQTFYFRFPFRNQNRKQFVSMIGYIC